MKHRLLFTAALSATGMHVLALLSACASDVAPSALSDTTDAATRADAFETDSGPDVEAAPCADCEYFPETCSPDVLCLNGPFDPSHPRESVDSFDLRTEINVIVGRGENDVWTAGSVGALAHFDGMSWRRSGPDTKETLQGLWLFDDGALAFGSKMNRVFLHGMDLPDASDGGWTSSQEVPTPSLYRNVRDYSFMTAWASPGAQWAWCGLSLTGRTSRNTTGLWRMRRLPNPRFEIQPATTNCGSPCQAQGIASIHGSSPDVLWAVGTMGTAYRIDGADGDRPTIEEFNSLTWNRLFGVWAASDSEAWAVGASGTIRHYVEGSPIAEVVPDIPPSVNLRAVWGSSPSDIWAVGDASVVLHYDGNSWSRMKIAGLAARRPDLTAVWMPSAGHVWIGGQGVIASLGGRP